MIIYNTKETRERYRLTPIEKMSSPLREFNQAIVDKESGDELLEWGAKLFYFDRRKCLQVVNFASKFTLFLIDVKVDALPYVPDYMFNYIFDIYKNDKVMTRCLKKMVDMHPFCTFSNLTDRSIISTLNQTESSFADYGYRFYDYIENGIMQSKKINRDINRNWLFTRKNGKSTEYFYGAERFRELVVSRFCK